MSATGSTPGVVRFGTRASTLARTQTGRVAETFAAATGQSVELVEIRTEGDRSTAPLATMGGTGVFVSALREALVSDRIDVAVHSLKDLPTAAFDGVRLAAVPAREDPRDALVARDGLTLGELPPGSRVGTGSPRRVAQLKALGLGIELVDVRGNVDTRIRKVADGDLDAVVLARAGISRLGRTAEITESLDPIQVLPAPGQGALAVECRSSDTRGDALREALEDRSTRAAVTCERTVLAELEAGCSAPVGALAEIVEGDHGEELWVRAVALSADGTLAIRRSATGTPDRAAELGADLAHDMLAEGAAELVGSTNSDPIEVPVEVPATTSERL